MMIEKRLKLVRDSLKLSQKAFGEQLKIPQTTYANYENGKSSLPSELLIVLADKFQINLHWLITGQGAMRICDAGEVEEIGQGKEIDCLSDNISVPMTSLKVSAGHGLEWGGSECSGEVIHVPKRVARRYPGNADFAGAAVVGDSMEPTLHDGEPVVFVKDYISGDGIYVLAVSGDLLVKRLEFDSIQGLLHIISDNPKYKPKEIPISGQDNVTILGKVVIWVHGEV